MKQQPKNSKFRRYWLFTLAIAGLLTAVQVPIFAGEEIRYNSGGRRDPFIPVLTDEGEMAEFGKGSVLLSIEGIMYDQGGKSIVLIEGEAYGVGDKVKGITITQIEPDKIRVQFGEDVQEIPLIADEIEKYL